MNDVAAAHETTAHAAVTSTGPPPLFWRVLRLRYVRPNGWQRAILVEGIFALAVILVLADVASAWTLLALPLVSGALVKANDTVARLLPNARPQPLPPARIGDVAPFVILGALIPILALTVHGTGNGILKVLGVGEFVAIAVAIYRYLRRRGCPKGRAVAIGIVAVILSPLAGILAAGLEARRLRQEAAERAPTEADDAGLDDAGTPLERLRL